MQRGTSRLYSLSIFLDRKLRLALIPKDGRSVLVWSSCDGFRKESSLFLFAPYGPSQIVCTNIRLPIYRQSGGTLLSYT